MLDDLVFMVCNGKDCVGLQPKMGRLSSSSSGRGQVEDADAHYFSCVASNSAIVLAIESH